MKNFVKEQQRNENFKRTIYQTYLLTLRRHLKVEFEPTNNSLELPPMKFEYQGLVLTGPHVTNGPPFFVKFANLEPDQKPEIFDDDAYFSPRSFFSEKRFFSAWYSLNKSPKSPTEGWNVKKDALNLVKKIKTNSVYQVLSM